MAHVQNETERTKVNLRPKGILHRSRRDSRSESMKPVKALHEELIHSVDWAASNQVAWMRNNRKALLAALELAQQAERLKAQLAEAEKLNETWSLAYERAQQQLAEARGRSGRRRSSQRAQFAVDGGRRESFANQICVCGHMRRDHRAWFCNLCYSCHGFIT